ncbi:hypothetical protein BGZ46_002014 [Entomortierella lignicola]|nr:hypothetical protein BGZ46_002014 [Entomortierella lignicola]
MSQGSPKLPANPNTGSSSDSAPGLRINVSAFQNTFPTQEILQSPLSASPPQEPGNALAPVNSNLESNSVGSSRTSSTHRGSSSSSLSDSGESVSSLGGLNHVNDGVHGSTVQRRMSRAYSADDVLQRQLSTDIRRPSATFAELQQQRPQFTQRTTSSASLLSSNGMFLNEKESCFSTWLRRWVPAYGWLISPGYNFANLPDDLIAGISKSRVFFGI